MNTRTREMPFLARRSPDGRYIIPQLYDEEYASISNKSSPVKALKEGWTWSPTFMPQYDGLPMSPMLESQYGFNAFISSLGQFKENVASVVNHTFNNDYYNILGGANNSLDPQMQISDNEVFARKVFVGGLPTDVGEASIYNTFGRFGKLVIDWPRHSEKETSDAANTRTMPGYAFLVYENEASVQMLVNKCYRDNDKLYLLVPSSSTMCSKPVQVRPWRLSDTDYIVDKNAKMWARRTVFIGGLPRPTRASDLAAAVEQLYGHVSYASIDIDPELKYPKGAARVVFSASESLFAAISGNYVYIQNSEGGRRVEIKPYIVEEQMCDQCEGRRFSGGYAPYFCGDFHCMQYFCEFCWDVFHTRLDHTFDHKPFVRAGKEIKKLDRPPHVFARNGYSGRHRPRFDLL